MRIAIVDDDATDRRMLHSRLEVQLARHSIHADISEYENGRKFLTEAAQEPFTLVFLDIYIKKCLRHLNPLAPIHGGIRGSFFYRFPA